MAVGDKVYLADKETLDDVKKQIGATTDPVGGENTGSVFGKLNKIINHVTVSLSTSASNAATYASNAYSKTIEILNSIQSHADDFNSRIGTSEDSGTSVLGKLNSIIEELTVSIATYLNRIDTSAYDAYVNTNKIMSSVKALETKYLRSYTKYCTLSVGTQTVVDLSGPGIFNGAVCKSFAVNYTSKITVIIDGTRSSWFPTNENIYLCRSCDGGPRPVEFTTLDMFTASKPLHFTQSFSIEVTLDAVATEGESCRVDYDLYE